jgi:hypothetical protein
VRGEEPAGCACLQGGCAHLAASACFHSECNSYSSSFRRTYDSRLTNYLLPMGLQQNPGQRLRRLLDRLFQQQLALEDRGKVNLS